MSQSGEHTWDLIQDYHLCPECGAIIESREKYQYQMGDWIKKLHCQRCENKFLIKKRHKPKFGPLIGEEQPLEWDWI